jgi:hypothetical protein
MPTSVAMVVSEFSGKPYSLHLEAEIAAAAAEHGWLEGGPGDWKGMTAEGGTQLLEHYGIDAHVENGSIEKLEEYKAEGRDVILTVDSDFVWYGSEKDGNPNIDHAVVFGGIDDSQHPPTVILEDPGTPQGRSEHVSLEEFEKAWAAGNNQMIVTDETPAWQTDTGEPPGAQPPEPQPSDIGEPAAPAGPDPRVAPDPTAAPQDVAPEPTAPAPTAPDDAQSPLQSPLHAPAGANLSAIPGQPFPGDHPSDARRPSDAGGAATWVARGAGAVILPIVLAGRELQRRRARRM